MSRIERAECSNSEEADLERLLDRLPEVEARIAFVHLGSLSAFPSPHELEKVRDLIRLGADLVVCSGNHFIRGLSDVDGIPVFWGTGNHLFGWRGENTEPVGMHVVAGMRGGTLEQLLVFPFSNDVESGIVGPLGSREFAEFQAAFVERSRIRDGAYFFGSDRRTIDGQTDQDADPESIAGPAASPLSLCCRDSLGTISRSRNCIPVSGDSRRSSQRRLDTGVPEAAVFGRTPCNSRCRSGALPRGSADMRARRPEEFPESIR